MRKMFIAVTGVFLLLFVVASPVLFPRPSSATKAAFDLIKAGMTLADVETLMDCPPGDYRTRPGEVIGALLSEEEIRGGYYLWQTDEGALFVLMEGLQRD